MHPRPSHPCILVLLLSLLVSLPAPALETFDFETSFLVHPGNQVWDFCVEKEGDLYHIFYHTIPVEATTPAAADTIWHATSPDLCHWDAPRPVLISGPDWWDAVAIWAPDVVFDDVTGRWAMLYTGVSEGMVQRACLAWSTDLENWTKDQHNPVFEPDSNTYMWSPDEPWSSFRDPFVYHEGGQWHMLNTAGLRLGGHPGYKQAIVHHAVSVDLVHWEDDGVFFAHDGSTGRNFDFESVQYIKRGGYEHLFFVEQNPALETHPTSLISGRHRSEWTMADRVYIDDGWAPEVKIAAEGNGRTLFARLHQYDNPHTGLTNVVVRFDPLVFRYGGRMPVVDRSAPLGDRWPHRTGQVGETAPTFGDNPVLRGEPSAGLEGHGWFSSYEHFGGPLSGVGDPGRILGDRATGSLTSEEFRIGADFLAFKVAGGNHPGTCYFAMLDGHTDQVLFRTTGGGGTTMVHQVWDLRGLKDRLVKLTIVDQEQGPDGWIALDSIREVQAHLAPAPEDLPAATGLGSVHPNPFNPSTTVSFSLRDSQQVIIEVYDLAGRRVRQLATGVFSAGEHQVRWDGRDASGQELPSGTYFLRLTDGKVDESHKITLMK